MPILTLRYALYIIRKETDQNMEFLFTSILGIVFIIIGVLNCKGNASMLHSYHRKRVREEDIIPFGKIVGTGMFFISGGMLGMTGLYYAASVTGNGL